MPAEEPRPSIADLIIEQIRHKEEQARIENEERERKQPTVEIYEDPPENDAPLKPQDEPHSERGVTEIRFFDGTDEGK